MNWTARSTVGFNFLVKFNNCFLVTVVFIDLKSTIIKKYFWHIFLYFWFTSLLYLCKSNNSVTKILWSILIFLAACTEHLNKTRTTIYTNGQNIENMLNFLIRPFSYYEIKYYHKEKFFTIYFLHCISYFNNQIKKIIYTIYYWIRFACEEHLP